MFSSAHEQLISSSVMEVYRGASPIQSKSAGDHSVANVNKKFKRNNEESDDGEAVVWMEEGEIENKDKKEQSKRNIDSKTEPPVSHDAHDPLSVSEEIELNLKDEIEVNEEPLQTQHVEVSLNEENDMYVAKYQVSLNEENDMYVDKYQCCYCDRSFIYKRSLMFHIREHTKGETYKCSRCSETFEGAFELVKHQQIHSSGSINSFPYQCSYCDEGFIHKNYLAMHVKTAHSVEQSHNCNQCDKVFTSSHHLMQHSKIHEKKRSYPCMLCEMSFTENGDLLNHHKTHIGKKLHVCSQCNKAFVTETKLTDHMAEHTKEMQNKSSQRERLGEYAVTRKEKLFNLKMTYKSIQREDALTGKTQRDDALTHKHQLIEYYKSLAEVKPFQCDHSDKALLETGILTHTQTHTEGEDITISENNDLIVHRKTHVGGQLYYCRHCNKSFPLNTKLIEKKAEDTPDTQCKSSQCENAFTEKHLVEHDKSHTGEKPYQCDHCEKAFSEKTDLLTHKQTHNEGKDIEISENNDFIIQYKSDAREKHPFCSHCNKAFLSNTKYIDHMSESSQCEKAFTDKHIVKHDKSHTGEKPYQCDHCGKNFSEKTSLLAHQQTHNEGEEINISENNDLIIDHKMHAGEELYYCRHCNKTFLSNAKFKKHMMNTKGKLCKPSNYEKEFLKKHSLLECDTSNTGEKPYQCCQCDKAFSHNHFLTHKQTHTEGEDINAPSVVLNTTSKQAHTEGEAITADSLATNPASKQAHTEGEDINAPSGAKNPSSKQARNERKEINAPSGSKIPSSKQAHTERKDINAPSGSKNPSSKQARNAKKNIKALGNVINPFSKTGQLNPLVTIIGKPPYFCGICNHDFSEKRILINHLMTHCKQCVQFTCTLDKLKKENDKLRIRAEAAESKVKDLEKMFHKGCDDIDEFEASACRPCLVINNLPPEVGKSDEEVFLNMCATKLNLNTGFLNEIKYKIAYIYRKQKSTNDVNVLIPKPQAMIVKFTDNRYKDVVFMNKDELENTEIEMSELLTSKQSALLKKCIEKIPGSFTERSISTVDDTIVVKTSEGEIANIKSESDLDIFLKYYFSPTKFINQSMVPHFAPTESS